MSRLCFDSRALGPVEPYGLLESASSVIEREKVSPGGSTEQRESGE